MKKWLLVDLANTYARARFVIKSSDVDLMAPLAIMICIQSIKAAETKFKCDGILIALEGRSWRKDFYPKYKANRADSLKSPEDKELDKIYYQGLNDLIEFFDKKTALPVVRCPVAEADDIIARWIYTHPNDEHIIFSSDTDFLQLIDTNVLQYDVVNKRIIRNNGYYDADKDKPLMDKKTKKNKLTPNPEYILFEKCIRGDTTDNVFSAYPGVRSKGSKNKVGIEGAFADRIKKGWFWNNFMKQKWEDIDGKTMIVGECYERNKILIDLNAQPDNIKEMLDILIKETYNNKKIVKNVEINFLRFCDKYQLEILKQHYGDYVRLFCNCGI